jgi:excisionase family DNA binding protein
VKSSAPCDAQNSPTKRSQNLAKFRLGFGIARMLGVWLRGSMSNARSPFRRDQVDDRRRGPSMSSARGPEEVHSRPSRNALFGEIVPKADPDIPCWARPPTDPELSTGGSGLSRHEPNISQKNSVRSSPRWPLKPNTSDSARQRRRAGRAPTLQPLLTMAQTAAVLNVSMRTIRRLAASGCLQPVRIGRSVRLRPQDIERMIADEDLYND